MPCCSTPRLLKECFSSSCLGCSSSCSFHTYQEHIASSRLQYSQFTSRWQLPGRHKKDKLLWTKGFFSMSSSIISSGNPIIIGIIILLIYSIYVSEKWAGSSNRPRVCCILGVPASTAT
uniref:Triple gene block2 n=1 Tax=Rumex interveinal chlorotic virus TaxID=1715695 RepID=A0A1J1LVP8_9VIRU|nr:triple gene block2 [Rumex interveinal chlorotic virus]